MCDIFADCGDELVRTLTRCLQEHSCAVVSFGGVLCWGKNDYGQVIL
jgi:hypothetical protein